MLYVHYDHIIIPPTVQISLNPTRIKLVQSHAVCTWIYIYQKYIWFHNNAGTFKAYNEFHIFLMLEEPP